MTIKGTPTDGDARLFILEAELERRRAVIKNITGDPSDEELSIISELEDEIASTSASTASGLLVKLRRLYRSLVKLHENPANWDRANVASLLRSVEQQADPIVLWGMELGAIYAAFNEIEEREGTQGMPDELTARIAELEQCIANREPSTLEGVMVQIKLTQMALDIIVSTPDTQKFVEASRRNLDYALTFLEQRTGVSARELECSGWQDRSA